MTTSVPTTAELLRDDPAVGGSSLAQAIAQDLQQTRENAHRFWLAVHGVGNGLTHGSGSAMSALTAALNDEVRPGAERFAESTAAAQQAFVGYTAELDRIVAEATIVQRDADGALALVREQADRIAELAVLVGVAGSYEWRAGPPLALPEPGVTAGGGEGSVGGVGDVSGVSGALNGNNVGVFVSTLVLSAQMHRAVEIAWWWAATAWRRGSAACAEAEAHWQGLLADRRDAERALTAGLRATTVGQLLVLAGRSGGGGSITLTGVGVGIGAAAIVTPTRSRAWSAEHPLLTRLLGSRSGAMIWDAPPDPAEVARAWQRLSVKDQKRLIDEVPWVVGNLPGLPFAARDRANQQQLAWAVRNPSRLTPNGRSAVAELITVLAADDGQPPVQLVSLDFTGSVPKAALGYGDLDRADHLSWQVPGMYNDLHEGVSGWDRGSRNLMREQERLLPPGQSSGLIAFFEYDTPNLFTVLSAETARAAAPRLAAELDGSRAAQAASGIAPRIGVIGHSYGTPVAAEALTLTQHPVQSFTMIASAGLDPATATALSDLNVARGADGEPNVFTTMAARDTLAPFGSNLAGRLQPNPDAAWSAERVVLGAHSFSSDGWGDAKATHGHAIIRDDGHGYLDAGTQAVQSIAALNLGQPDKVPGGIQQTVPRTPNMFELRESPLPIGGRR